VINWTSRTRTVLVALAVAMLVVPAALAKGKPPTTGPDCKPKVSVILKGTLTSDPGPGATSFTMTVTKANKHGKSLVGQTVTIAVNADTKVRREGKKAIEDLASGDRVNVQIRRCKGDPPLTTDNVDDVAAKRVNAHPPKPPETEDGDD